MDTADVSHIIVFIVNLDYTHYSGGVSIVNFKTFPAGSMTEYAHTITEEMRQ